ncbi:MAG TPA: DUF4440 domain-containing protein [Chthoniobacterales bacterium]
MRRLLFLIPMLLLATPVFANDEDAKIRATLENRYQEWISAANNKDVTALMKLYDDNAVLMPKSQEPVLGKTAIGEYYLRLLIDPNFVAFTPVINWNSFYVMNDIAIATSVFDGAVTRGGKKVIFRAKELMVWKKQTDGSWKLFRYMFDEIPPKK